MSEPPDPAATWGPPDGGVPWPQRLPDAGPAPGARVVGATDWRQATGGVPPVEQHLSDPPLRIRWGMGDVALGLLVWLGVQLVVGIVVAIAYLSQLDDLSDVDDVSQGDLPLWALGVGVVGGWVALAGWPWVVSRWKGQRSLRRDFGWSFRWIDVPIGIAGGVAALILSLVAAALYMVVVGDEPPTNTGILPTDDTSFVTVAVLLGLVAVGTPIAEELFFRGLVLGAARKSWGTAWGLVVSSLIFGVLHAFGSPTLAGAPFIVVVTGLFGAVLGALRILTQGRLAAAIIGHATINGVGVISVLFLGA